MKRRRRCIPACRGTTPRLPPAPPPPRAPRAADRAAGLLCSGAGSCFTFDKGLLLTRVRGGRLAQYLFEAGTSLVELGSDARRREAIRVYAPPPPVLSGHAASLTPY